MVENDEGYSQKRPRGMDENDQENKLNSLSQIFGGESLQTIREQSFAENSSNFPAKQKIDNKHAPNKKIFNTGSDPYLLARFL